MKKLLDYDAFTGITQHFHYDDANDTFTIETHQDMTGLVEANKQALKDNHGKRWGNHRVAARIPASIYAQMVAEGKDRDPAYLRRWLNDPDNAYFRTFPGRI